MFAFFSVVWSLSVPSHLRIGTFWDSRSIIVLARGNNCQPGLVLQVRTTKIISGGVWEFFIQNPLQQLADDTSLLIERCVASLKACVQFINSFIRISGLHANLDKTRVIPFGANFSTKDILCPELPLKWEDSFTLLGIDIDNKLKQIDSNLTRYMVKQKALSMTGRQGISPFKVESTFQNACLWVNTHTLPQSFHWKQNKSKRHKKQ